MLIHTILVGSVSLWPKYLTRITQGREDSSWLVDAKDSVFGQLVPRQKHHGTKARQRKEVDVLAARKQKDWDRRGEKINPSRLCASSNQDPPPRSPSSGLTHWRGQSPHEQLLLIAPPPNLLHWGPYMSLWGTFQIWTMKTSVSCCHQNKVKNRTEKREKQW